MYGVCARIGGVSDELGISFCTPEGAAEYARLITTPEGAERSGYESSAEWAYAVDENGLAI